MFCIVFCIIEMGGWAVNCVYVNGCVWGVGWLTVDGSGGATTLKTLLWSLTIYSLLRFIHTGRHKSSSGQEVDIWRIKNNFQSIPTTPPQQPVTLNRMQFALAIWSFLESIMSDRQFSPYSLLYIIQHSVWISRSVSSPEQRHYYTPILYNHRYPLSKLTTKTGNKHIVSCVTTG